MGTTKYSLHLANKEGGLIVPLDQITNKDSQLSAFYAPKGNRDKVTTQKSILAEISKIKTAPGRVRTRPPVDLGQNFIHCAIVATMLAHSIG